MTKILLVEDDKSLREIYGVRLLAEGYDIVSAGDGEEALAMAIKERPQLIVSDVMMPKISGFDMLDILRSTSETRDIKVIMMTALSSEDQRQRGEQLGADRYLVKSQVGIEDVVRTVHEVLGDQGETTGQPISYDQQPQYQQPQPAQPEATPAPPEQTTASVVDQLSSPQNHPPAASEDQTGSFPEPTAPFSSPRPATLGERIIQPIGNPNADTANLGDRIEQVLQQGTDQPTAAPQPAQPAQPEATPAQPAAPAAPPQPESPTTPAPATTPTPVATPAPQPAQPQAPPQQPEQPQPAAQPQPEQPATPAPHGAQPYTPNTGA